MELFLPKEAYSLSLQSMIFFQHILCHSFCKDSIFCNDPLNFFLWWIPPHIDWTSSFCHLLNQTSLCHRGEWIYFLHKIQLEFLCPLCMHYRFRNHEPNHIWTSLRGRCHRPEFFYPSQIDYLAWIDLRKSCHHSLHVLQCLPQGHWWFDQNEQNYLHWSGK